MPSRSKDRSDNLRDQQIDAVGEEAVEPTVESEYIPAIGQEPAGNPHGNEQRPDPQLFGKLWIHGLTCG